MAKITIDGTAYRVVESVGYNHTIGAYVKIVADGDRDRTAVKQGGAWRFWTAKDRVAPLVEHLERIARFPHLDHKPNGG